ncbi:hypothetical protein TCAL_00909 [Tigriopus californicus]|uniref:TNFR-Cys domain-containing protein n=1 Tax=Tigriopus californicus TaxID=6832 RepID=A0A553P5Y0_TIGCA|nr:uncharacterized protein LOC131877524 isoform X1 [Tigriopus californicus]TRY73093.1 hypothetical protein TCAL_00909 [Tigriopus californicus]
MIVLSTFVLLQLLDLCSSLRVPSRGVAANRCPDEQFWSWDSQTCVACSQCFGTVPVVPCSNFADAICPPPKMVKKSLNSLKSPTELVKEKIKNASKRKFEFMEEFRKQVNISPRDPQSDDLETSVMGRIKYKEDPTTMERKSDLHSDLQLIERELFLEDELLKEQLSTKAITESTSPTPEEVTRDSETNWMKNPVPNQVAQDDQLLVGKKRFFATSHPQATESTPKSVYYRKEAVVSVSTTASTVSVFGAIVQQPNEITLKHQTADEFGLIHSLLFRDHSQNEEGESDLPPMSTSSSSSAPSTPSHGGLTVQHGLIVLGLLMVCVLSAVIALIYKKRTIMQQHFKVLDNHNSTGGIGPCSLNQTHMSSHNSSLRRSPTDSRLTSQSSVPTSPSSTTYSSSIYDQGAPNTSSIEGQTQMYLSYVDHQGRTQLKSRDMAV